MTRKEFIKMEEDMNKLHFITIIIYISILNLTYIYIVSPLFGYAGLIYDPNIYKFLFAQITTIILLVIHKKRDVPSSTLVYFLFLNLYIPFINFYWLRNENTQYSFMIFICFFILLLLLRVSKPININKLPIKIKIEIETLILILTFILVSCYTLKFGGIDYRSFDFTKVYEIRSEVEYGLLWSYLFNWISKLFIPFLIVVFYFKNKYFILSIIVFIQIFLYLSTGSKTILFSSFIILISCFLIKRNKFLTGIPIVYSLIMTISSAIYLYTKNINLIAIFPIRQLILPAQISFQHYDFFSLNEKLYLREGLLGKILYLKSPYSRPSTTLVGDGNSNANTNFLADAFDNGGFLLMIITIMILAVLLIYIDSVSNYWINNKIFASFFIYTIIILNDGALLTTILTWGLGILLLLILFVNPKKGEKNEKNRKNT